MKRKMKIKRKRKSGWSRNHVLKKAKQSESFMDMLREDARKMRLGNAELVIFLSDEGLSSSSSQKSREQTKIYYKTIENDTKLIVRVVLSVDQTRHVGSSVSDAKRKSIVRVLVTILDDTRSNTTEKLDQEGCSQLLLKNMLSVRGRFRRERWFWTR